MAQYPAKPDIIKTGPRETPTYASGFSVSVNNLNERKTLHRAVPKELYFRTLHRNEKDKSIPNSQGSKTLAQNRQGRGTAVIRIGLLFLL